MMVPILCGTDCKQGTGCNVAESIEAWFRSEECQCPLL
jgi:hypothetical protein